MASFVIYDILLQFFENVMLCLSEISSLYHARKCEKNKQ